MRHEDLRRVEDRVDQDDAWQRARRFGGPFVAQRHRTCRVCSRKFLTGALIVEGGYATSAVCEICLEDARDGRIDLADYF
jgi:hypothetical protein